MTPCDSIDGYVGEWLEESERVRFEEHLLICAQCRAYVQDQQRIDRLLSDGQPRTPALLVERIDLRIRRTHRRRLIGAGMAAAACAALTIFLIGRLSRDSFEHQLPAIAEAETFPSPPNVEMLPVRVTFAPEADVIAVPRNTGNPRVTIIWIYPTPRLATQSEIPPTEPTISFERSES